MIPALIGFGLGWLARGLWERQRSERGETVAPGERVEAEVPPAAAFARGPVSSGGGNAE